MKNRIEDIRACLMLATLSVASLSMFVVVAFGAA